LEPIGCCTWNKINVFAVFKYSGSNRSALQREIVGQSVEKDEMQKEGRKERNSPDQLRNPRERPYLD